MRPVHVVTVNAGSSSVRLAAYRAGRDAPLRRERREVDGLDPVRVLRAFAEAAGLAAPDAVAHRVVHGGPSLVRPVRLDARVEAELARLAALAPLHNPAALQWLRAARAAFGEAPAQVAAFDTAFFADLPPEAAEYAVPRDLARRHGVRRYGFHGLAHASMLRRWRELRPDLDGGGRVVSLQLGGGASVTASRGGRPVDTSMGFSPLAGLVMGTRCGDLDPAVPLFLQRAAGLTVAEVEDVLNHRSGLLGLSGVSADVRDLAASPDPAARLALDAYVHAARRYVGAYLAVLGGADAILFGGGVGEHQPALRARLLADLEWAGVRVDAARNAATVGTEGRVSADGSPVDVWVVPPDEERLLADAAFTLIDKTPLEEPVP